MNLAGLNVEGAEVRAAVIRKGFAGRGARLLHTEDFGLPADRAARSDALKEIIKKLAEAHAIKGVVFGLPPSLFSHHLIEMPRMKKEELRGAVAFELERHLPLLPEEYSFDFMKTGDRQAAGLFLLAARKDALNWLAEAVAAAGVKLLGIRCSVLELLNDFFAGEQARPGSFVFAYAGRQDCHIAVVRGGVVETMKTVPLSMAQAEVERLSKKESLEVFTAGQSCFNPALCYRNITMDIAHSVANSAARKGVFRMDFTPPAFVPEKRDPYAYSLWSMAGLCVLFYFLTPVVGFYRDYASSRSVRQEIDGLKSTASELLEIRRELEEIRQKKRFLLEFQGRMNMPVKVLSAISEAMPKEAWLQGFSVDEKGKVEIRGFSNKSALLISPLEKSPVFRKVEFSNPVVTREGMERFSIRMEIER